MKKTYLFATLVFLLFAGTALSAAITNSVHLTGQTIDGVGVVNGTFTGDFNISNVSDCSVAMDTANTPILTDANGRWAYYFDTSVVSSNQLWVGYNISRASPAYSESGCIRYSPTAYCEAWDGANDYYLNDNKKIFFNTAASRYFRYDLANNRFEMNNNLGIGGTRLYMNGESAIYGGTLAMDSITLYGSTIQGSPAVAVEAGAWIANVLKTGSTEKFKVQDNSPTPTTLFQVEADGDAGVLKDLSVGGVIYGNGSGITDLDVTPDRAADQWLFFNTPTKTKGIRYQSSNGVMEVGNNTDMLFQDGYGTVYGTGGDAAIYYDATASEFWIDATNTGDDLMLHSDVDIELGTKSGDINVIPGTGKSTTIGDGGTSDYAEFSDGGEITLYGDARKYRQIDTYAYNIYGNAATYNGISCDAAAGAVLSDTWVVKTFDDCSGFGNNPDAAIATLKIPLDYEDGTNFSVDIHWTAASTAGNIVVGVGVLPVGQGENYAASETYKTATLSAPSTANYEQEKVFEFSGTGVQADDDVALVLYRDCNDGSDTMTGDALVTTISLRYQSNKWGEDI